VLDTPSATLDASGVASTTATANAVGGSYQVTASAGGSNTLAFSLFNYYLPVFNALASPSIQAGTPTLSLSGHLGDSMGNLPPEGESVSITLAGMTNTTTLDAAGDFSITFNTAALTADSSPYTIAYSYAGDDSFASASDNSTSLTVTPAAASYLVSGFPSPTVAGTEGMLTVTARDAAGKVLPGYRGTIHFTSTDAQATLPSDYTFTAADNGVHVFSATLNTAGTRSLTVTDTVLPGSTGRQSGIVVQAGAASTLFLSGSTTTAGLPYVLTLKAQDAYGNVATSYRGTVHFTSSDPKAVLPPNYTFTATDKGVHKFTTILKTAGAQSVSVVDTSAPLSGEANLTIKPGAASKLVLSGLPTTLTAGGTVTFTVTAQDAYGNTATSFGDTVHFSSSDTQATLPADYAFVAADQGVHTFSATLQTAGTRTVKVTDTTRTTLYKQASVQVIAAAATHFLVTSSASVTAGSLLSVTVKAVDAYGNVDASYRGTVQFSSTDPAAVLPGPYAFVPTDKGAHTFSRLVLHTVGAQTLSIVDTLFGAMQGNDAINVV
jgi:hypothetical protein